MVCNGPQKVARVRSGTTPRTLNRPSSSPAAETRASTRLTFRKADGANASAHRPVGGSWQFLTLRGTWQQHSAAACHQLERAFQTNKPTCCICTPAGQIEVDL